MTSDITTTAYLALGSNSGDRAGNLREACQCLEENPALHIAARSLLYETQSVEGGGPDDFLNAALRIETTLSARELLSFLQSIESTLGRALPPRAGPRCIDIDILLFGEQTIDEPDLQVPHPRMQRRAFVLRPLCDVLKGGWVRPAHESW